MGTALYRFIVMELAARLIRIRKDKGLSQQALADLVGLHVTQIKRYESGATQPSLEALKKIARTFSVTTDFLLFDEGERDPDDDLKLHFEAVKQFSPEEKRIAKAVIEGLILKHDAGRFTPAAKR